MSNETTKLIHDHRSIRKYTDEPISDEILNDILTSAQWAPTSHYIQGYSIIVIKNPEAKFNVSEFCRGQHWIKNCPVFLVFCIDYYRLKVACEMHGTEFKIPEVENIIVGSVDVALAAQNAYITARSYGLGGVMIGGVRNNPEKISEYLKLPKYVVPLLGLSIGYPDANPWQKPRLPLKAVVHNEVYNQDDVLQEALAEYDSIVSDYYTRRTDGKRTESWTEQMATYYKKKKRPHLKNFLLEKGFNVE